MLNKISALIFIMLLCSATVVWATQPDSGQFVFSGSTPHALLGCSVSGAGDVNNDGYDDVIIGTCGHEQIGSYTDRDSTGVAYVISGVDGTVLYVLTGDSLGDMFGQIVGAAGDVNNDDHDDVIVGAPQLYRLGIPRLHTWDITKHGYARVISGKDKTILATYYGSGPDSVLGSMLSNKNIDAPSAEVNLGDINRDGVTDFAVADKYSDTNGTNSGSVWIYSGADNTVLYAFNDGMEDRDRDSIPDLVDNCLTNPNREQEDGDHDDIGDMCDFDKDNDGVEDIDDSTPNGDNDGDGIDNLSDILPNNPYQCSKAGWKYARKNNKLNNYKKVCRKSK